MSTKDIEGTYPLSPMQQAMLFRYQLDPKSGLYIQQVLGSLHEELNVAAFQRAWERVVTRHPVLRTSFRWEGTDEPMQDVHTYVSLPFEERDWRNLTSAGQQSRFAEFLKLDRSRGFDLSQAPLVRVALFRTGETDYRLLCTYHHIIADRWARAIIIDEVFAFYDAYCEGRDLHLERPRPYRDHIDWLRQMDHSASEMYWQQLLKGFKAPTAVDVIPKFDRSDDQEGYGEQETHLSTRVTSRLRSVAKQHHVTLNTMVQGAWALLLSRYTREEDVVFGAVRHCRRSTVEGAGSVVGLFLNTLPVRVRTPSDQNLIDRLEALREQHIAVRDHEQTPLGHVVGWSEVPRGTPLFESIVVFDRARLNTRLRERGGSWLNREFHVIEDPAFALVLHAYGENELLLKFLYDKRRFDHGTIERMLGHLKTLLESMAETLDRPLADLPILTAPERHQVLVQWNDTHADYPQDRCLHELFEAQVERTPDAIAVSFEGEHLTYRAFNARANQLAHHLQKLGVGPETLVGVYMERSLEMVIALYGILKAGGAYVPLDPEYPADRVAFMLQDAQVPVLLTQQRLTSSLPNHRASVLCLDSQWETLAQENDNNPVSDVRPDNLAYVIYTSGSTGKPKGTMNTHRGICNRLLWMQDRYQLTESDRILQKTPFSFDVSVWEFFWPLLVGARLIVAQPGGHKDSAYLVRLICDQEITTIHFVPSMLQLFLEERDLESCTSLRRVICSGEALPYDLQERFFERLEAELHNLYGPTEAAVDVSHWQCQPEGDSRRSVPIGRPVANTELYILDRHGQPVPIGVAGELHIGGVQVARGYLNRPELTAKKFIPDPFSKDPEARLYKTGDLTRYRPDGSIEFLGRLDFQVKVRGFRIELGEIEAVLSQHPTVREAVVLAREESSGDRRLVAYVVPAAASEIQSSALRDYLHSKLPDYMVPAAFVQLETLPLLPNGKIDRRALPKPEGKRPELGRQYVGPRDKLESFLASIWREILRLDRVGVHDRFFELGGTSIQAARFVNRLQKELGENIYIVSIFEKPTVAKYAEFLQRDYGESLARELGLAPLGSERSTGLTMQRQGGIDEKTIARMEACIPTLSHIEEDDQDDKNPPAIFVLAPPRSGTTLLRVMLAGHPDLFAASELQLLGFSTLSERRAAYTGKYSLWLEGTIRAIMELQGWDARRATRAMEEYEAQGYTTKQFYRVLQTWIDDRILVDKSPSYVLDLNTLEKAERDFRDALYIHLVRHPYAMVRSFVNYHMDQVLYLKDHPFSPRQLGELVWLISHRNAQRFLQGIPSHRQCHVRFEDLLTQPRSIMEELCDSLRLRFHPELIRPYHGIEHKMTDGIHKESKPMGDTRFLEHGKINPEVAKAWEGVLVDDFLSDYTWELAVSLGYERPEHFGSGTPTQRETETARAYTRRRLLRQRRQHRQRRREE